MNKPARALLQQPAVPSFIMLAPMEGVVTHTMRAVFSAIGGVDRCVTEFVRVSKLVLPDRVFQRYYPEMHSNSRTASGTPVYLQLLGDDSGAMAANAAKAARLGACGIDINYGCPARTVNNHGGGAFLLQDPENLWRITSAIREAVPPQIPVTAKMRLGYRDKSLAIDNALALQEAGASEIAVHARTKTDGYRPPAYWEDIAKIREALHIPVIANGEIWTTDDLQRCQDQSGCNRIMLGRGLIASPGLALYARGQTSTALHWGDISLLLIHYFHELEPQCQPQHLASLIKQWLVYLRQQYADAHLFFEHCKGITDPGQMKAALLAEFRRQQPSKPASGYIGKLNLTCLLRELDDIK